MEKEEKNKLFKVRWSFHGADGEWHSGDVYKDLGIFSNKETAEKLAKIVKSKKSANGNQKYDAYVSEITINEVDEFYLDLLDLKNDIKALLTIGNADNNLEEVNYEKDSNT